MSNKMNKVEVNWLGSCDRCGCDESIVTTELGCENYLYEGDDVKCSECGLSGVVTVTDDYADDAVASVLWNEFEDE